MKIIVLGAGVIGVTSAWYLAKSGHQVTVIDRQSDVALETSFANAGQVSPGYSTPWAAPGVPLKAVKWLLQDLSPLRINPFSDPSMFAWLLKLLLNCSDKRYQFNKRRMLCLAQYSRHCLVQLRDELSLDYEQRMLGTLQVFRHPKQLKAAQGDIRALEKSDISYQLLGVEQCFDYEPALADSARKLVGGLRLPNDETGDCYKFTQQLKKHCESLGVNFLFDHNIQHLSKENQRISMVSTDKGRYSADAFVMALGSYSPLLLNPLGIKLPIYPVKGYSLTVPILIPQKSPVSTVMDETYKVAVSRLNNRIRVGGTAELNGYNIQLPKSRHANVDFVLNDLFAGAGDMSQAQYWTGLRPMTPNGMPILGTSSIDNLFLNSGHGTLGWTMATGSARYLSDVINQKSTDIVI